MEKDTDLLTPGDSSVPVDFPVSVVLPAAGCGERFGEDLPKQFTPVLGQPLFVHTICKFHR